MHNLPSLRRLRLPHRAPALLPTMRRERSGILAPIADRRAEGLRVKKKDTVRLYMASSAPGYYGSQHDRVKKYKGVEKFVSRAEARKLGTKSPVEKGWDSGKLAWIYQSNMCLTPVPVLEPESGTVEKGLRCLGCKIAYDKHSGCAYCQVSLPGGVDVDANEDSEDHQFEQHMVTLTCRALVARESLYSKEGLLALIEQCEEARVILGRKMRTSMPKYNRDGSLRVSGMTSQTAVG